MIARHVAVIFVSLLLAALLQGSLSSRIAIGMARPDFLTITLVCLALITGFGRSVAAGLWAGFLTAALCGMNFGSYMVSRCAAAAAAASIPRPIQRDSLLLPVASVVVATMLAELVYFLMAPVSPIAWWLKLVAGQIAYNAVLAAPIFWLIRRFMPQPKNRLAFAPQRR